MPSYAVTGASRGIGLEFVRQLSLDAHNSVFALVRNIEGSHDLKELARERLNIHTVYADLTNNDSLKTAAQLVRNITGGSLEYLINNAAYIPVERRFYKLTDYIGHEDELSKDFADTLQTNVVGVIQTINAFLPLLEKGTAKKVIIISSQVADVDFTLATDYVIRSSYSASKAALNVINAKYASQFRDEGFMFLAITPGVVKTATVSPTPEDMAEWIMCKKFKKAAPQWNEQLLTPEESVGSMLEVIYKFTSVDSGLFVSHHGNKEWL